MRQRQAVTTTIALLVVSVSSCAVRAWTWRWIAAGFSSTRVAAMIALSSAVTASCAWARRCGVIDQVTIRFGPTQAVMFLVGLLLLAFGAALTARAAARSTTLARWSGLPLAVGIALFLPQFYGPPAVRIAHGLLVTAGALTLATELWRTSRSAPT